MKIGSSRVQHPWSDAWLLLAIGLRPDGAPLSLAGLLQHADAVQHAIPTFDEVDGGLARLQAAGLLGADAGRIRLTPTGLELLRATGSARTTLRDRQQAPEGALGATPWFPEYIPERARRDPALLPVITVADYEAAIQANGYKRS